MGKFKIAISDDDQTSRTLLRHYIELFPDFMVIGEAASGEELIQLVMNDSPDIILVDINMPGMSGIETVKVCKQFKPSIQVIFTTGFDEYAVEAFNLSALDYLIKPIEISRFSTSLDKAAKTIALLKSAELKFIQQVKKLTLKTNNSYLYLPVDDILFLERESRKTIIHTLDKQYETNEALQSFEDKLNGDFCKTHRSFLVNLKKIVHIQPIGESYTAHFSNYPKKANISKLKFNEVQETLSELI
ncbi:LytR/AlgR family response regulator transcription factor [Bacillus massiliglaciei]|uniref:LytR/AlgR family response regulator transcription factor n=1 Tax=Bacillus massiliglaciei TaxID=1816693 RepID=UPI000DA6330D|nr:LytTR family DNA-binding domain-containing protein [Bacillus massiliglaciei]